MSVLTSATLLGKNVLSAGALHSKPVETVLHPFYGQKTLRSLQQQLIQTTKFKFVSQLPNHINAFVYAEVLNYQDVAECNSVLGGVQQ